MDSGPTMVDLAKRLDECTIMGTIVSADWAGYPLPKSAPLETP